MVSSFEKIISCFHVDHSDLFTERPWSKSGVATENVGGYTRGNLPGKFRVILLETSVSEYRVVIAR
jgi:hypothetical protein